MSRCGLELARGDQGDKSWEAWELGPLTIFSRPALLMIDDYSWDQRQEGAKGEEKMGVPTADEVASESDDLTS